jgi:DNA-binding NarL/FixJ family response regulator
MIAEDSGLLRGLLVEQLTSRGVEITGQATTKAELLSLVAAQPPDAVILDIRLPPDHSDEGLQAAEEIRRHHPRVALLVLSHYGETRFAARLLECAADRAGYLVKDRVNDIDHLTDALHRVVAGEMVIDPEIVRRLLTRKRHTDPLDRLTPRERLALELMARGNSNAGIARELGCTAKTVEKYVTAISRKLDLGDSAGSRADVNTRVLAVLTFLRANRP